MTAVAELAPTAGRPVAARRALTDERLAATALGGAFCLLVALTWRKWGIPEVDAGAELTAAERVAHGAMPYRDVRYFYGPLGLLGLAGAFGALGPSLTVAFGFGLAQAAAIVAVFHALCRRWLPPAPALLAGAVVLAIGFSGTAYNFVLPHTNSATLGLLCLLAMLLAAAHGRHVAAGLLLGLTALTRPEFAAVALAAAVAHVAGVGRDCGARPALGAAVRLGFPALAVAGAALGTLAALVGPHRLFLESLWPVEFLREAGLRTQQHWMPFTPESAVGLLARGALYAVVAAAVIAAASRAGTVRGTRARARAAAGPLALAAGALAFAALAWRITGAAGDERAALEREARHLLVPMSALPLWGLAGAAWAAWRFARGRPAPLSGRWAADAPLLVAAAALGLRAYAAFTAEESYAPYYAAPLVLLLAIAHHRAARGRAARAASLGVLAAAALGLAAYALGALHADERATVHTPRGAYVADARAGPGTEAAIRALAGAPPGTAVLVAPADPGLYFLSGRRPALEHLMMLPGLLDADAERAAVRRLRDGGVRIAVVAERDLGDFGPARFGADHLPRLGAWLRGATVAERRVGDGASVRGSMAAGAYRLGRLRER